MDVVEFSRVTGRLKGLDRTGWIMQRVPKPESVAEHIFRTTLLAMVFAKGMHVDQLKLMKMALIHDVGEALTGDIVTDRGRSVDRTLRRKKMAKELSAVKRIFSLTGQHEYIALFKELEEGKTAEAKLVDQIDKLEMVLQAYEYESKYKVDLEEFYQTGFVRLKDRRFRKILRTLYSSRPKRLRGKTKP
jgi:putative hydrolase of HD superfamily